MNSPGADGGLSGASDESQCFDNHAPQQRTRGLAFHQQAADQLGGNLLCLGGRRRIGGGAGRAWWLWVWLREEVLRSADKGAGGR